MIKKVDHLVITTAVPEQCKLFYQTLGFTVKECAQHMEFFAGDFKINVHIKGKELEPKAAYVQTGSADFCLETEEPLGVCKERLESQGIQIELGIVARTGAKGAMSSIYMRDPDGNLVELCSYNSI